MLDRDLALADLRAAFGLLTRLPLPMTGAPRADACWAWPAAGAVVGGLAALVAVAGMAMGLPAGPAAALSLITAAVLTGGLHEDGLADSADGLYGGRDKARRLEIMKDSRIGSYGTLALLMGGLLRWSALVAVLAAGHWGALLAVGALSRAPMAVLMAALPNARGSGLSQSVGRPGARAAAGAAVLALALALVTAGGAAVPMALAAGMATLAVARIARAKIGGQTGDILGAAQQISEAAALLVAAALLG